MTKNEGQFHLAKKSEALITSKTVQKHKYITVQNTNECSKHKFWFKHRADRRINKQVTTFGQGIIYYIIYYHMILYTELRESQTATTTFSTMLRFFLGCRERLARRVERWSAVTLRPSGSEHWLAVITRLPRQSSIFQLERKCRVVSNERARPCQGVYAVPHVQSCHRFF